MTQYIYIDSNAGLAQAAEGWQQCTAIALDTEFMRSNTFYPQTALIQIADGQHNYLIDPLAISDFKPLVAVLSAPQITKVLHSCSEDLEVFQAFLDVVPSPLFDTQIAAAFCGIGFSLGYAGLLEKMLGQSISKSETRSDWLQRPLSEAQREYAAQDVDQLLDIHQRLCSQLEALGRSEWFAEDSAALVEAAKAPADYRQYYLRVKNTVRLNRRGLALLQALCAWREEEARARDKPRNHIVHERSLFDISFKQPRSHEQLRATENLRPAELRRYGEALLQVIASVDELDPSLYPPRVGKPLTPAQGELAKRLRSEAQSVAEALQVPAELLLRKKDIDHFLRSAENNGEPQLPPGTSRWRQDLLLDRLREVIA